MAAIPGGPLRWAPHASVLVLASWQ